MRQQRRHCLSVFEWSITSILSLHAISFYNYTDHTRARTHTHTHTHTQARAYEEPLLNVFDSARITAISLMPFSNLFPLQYILLNHFVITYRRPSSRQVVLIIAGLMEYTDLFQPSRTWHVAVVAVVAVVNKLSALRLVCLVALN